MCIYAAATLTQMYIRVVDMHDVVVPFRPFMVDTTSFAPIQYLFIVRC